MPTPQILTGLSEVADRYDAVLCDVWGVIHNGVDYFPDACAALQRFQDTRGPVVLITNSPRPFGGVVEQLGTIGVPRGTWSGVVTSGDATRKLLAERAPGPALKIGPEWDELIYAGLGMAFADVAHARFISCTGSFHDETETPEDYRPLLTEAAARKLPMVCANPDRVVQRGDRMIYCAGALADLYETLGGEVAMAGKPYAPIYDLAVAELDKHLGQIVDRSRILCIGDGLPTDVVGANEQNLDCLFVANGIHAVEASDDHGRLDAAKLSSMLTENKVHAAYALAALVW